MTNFRYFTFKKVVYIVSRQISTKSKLGDSDLRKKIVYNCLLFQDSAKQLPFHMRKKTISEPSLISDNAQENGNDAIFLKYLENPRESELKVEPNSLNENEVVKFPYQQLTPVTSKPLPDIKDDITENLTWDSTTFDVVHNIVKEKNWLPHDPQISNETIAIGDKNYSLKYGTTDPNIPVSKVPCGGCGALLHCQNTSIPGFVPKEIFQGLNNLELTTLVCQRCHFLNEYDVALNVDVTPNDYPRILEPIKGQKALVLLMVDLLDLPCSIWPGIMDTIGLKRPVVVVANKVDLLVQDSPQFLDNIRESLLDCLLDSGIPKANIKHIAFISAKSGYGVENLITQIHTNWQYQGDIYIVGCTNVGKSTLFNTLIQSDLCKVQAVNVMQKATVSEWPGTTLNLLKFPILRPSNWRLYVRKSRMMEAEKEEMKAMALRAVLMKKSKYKKQSPLTGVVGRSFNPECTIDSVADPFSVAISAHPQGISPIGLNPNIEAFKDSKWCYDTPGVVHPDQILNLLTTPEILNTLPQSLIVPRVTHLRSGFSILIAGLARLDYISGPDFAWLTVFASETLPLTLTKTEDVEEVYHELLGTEILKVPSGGSERLRKWPPLESKTFEVSGKYYDDAAADLVLSSAGWVAVTVNPAECCVLRAWTPSARGLHLRPPFIKKAHKMKGSRIPRTPVFLPIQILNKEQC